MTLTSRCRLSWNLSVVHFVPCVTWINVSQLGSVKRPPSVSSLYRVLVSQTPAAVVPSDRGRCPSVLSVHSSPCPEDTSSASSSSVPERSLQLSMTQIIIKLHQAAQPPTPAPCISVKRCRWLCVNWFDCFLSLLKVCGMCNIQEVWVITKSNTYEAVSVDSLFRKPF